MEPPCITNCLIHITGNRFGLDTLSLIMGKIWSHWRSAQWGLPWASLISCPRFSSEGRRLINILSWIFKKIKKNYPNYCCGSQSAKRGSEGHSWETNSVVLISYLMLWRAGSDVATVHFRRHKTVPFYWFLSYSCLHNSFWGLTRLIWISLESLYLQCFFSFPSVASQEFSEEVVISVPLLNSGRFLFHDLVQIQSELGGKILIMGSLRLEVVEFSSQKDAPPLGCLHVLLLVWELWGSRRNCSHCKLMQPSLIQLIR